MLEMIKYAWIDAYKLAFHMKLVHIKDTKTKSS